MRLHRTGSRTASAMAGRRKRPGMPSPFWWRAAALPVQYRKSVKLPAPVALAVVDDDTEHAVRLDANFDETWGDKLELATLLEHGKEGRHTVTIRLAETHEDDAVPFYLVSVIAAGRRGRD